MHGSTSESLGCPLSLPSPTVNPHPHSTTHVFVRWTERQISKCVKLPISASLAPCIVGICDSSGQSCVFPHGGDVSSSWASRACHGPLDLRSPGMPTQPKKPVTVHDGCQVARRATNGEEGTKPGMLQTAWWALISSQKCADRPGESRMARRGCATSRAPSIRMFSGNFIFCDSK